MTYEHGEPRVTSFAPQFLVDDLERSIAYYQKIGFTFGEPWEGFYAIGVLDGLELHLKEAPKNDADRQHRRNNDHLDASAGVDGIEAFYEQCIANEGRWKSSRSLLAKLLAGGKSLRSQCLDQVFDVGHTDSGNQIVARAGLELSIASRRDVAETCTAHQRIEQRI